MQRRFLQRAAIKIWRLLTPRFSLRAGTERISVSGNNLKVAALLTWTHAWKAEVIRQVFQVRKGGAFIDIGANVGQTLLDFTSAGVSGRYIGFEPHPSSFSSLCTLVHENRFPACTILPIGISDTQSVINLYSAVGATTDQGATIVVDLHGKRELEHTAIFCAPFDGIRRDLDVDAIGLIKIDVEGAELAVLRGMERTLVEGGIPVICEILYANENADMVRYGKNINSIMEFLTKINYAIFHIRKSREDKFLGLARATTIPVRVWTRETASECDYLLVPADAIESYTPLMQK